MGLLDQVSNTVSYQIHKATYDPEAERFAKKTAEDAAKKAKEEEAAKQAAVTDAQKKAAAEAEAAKKTALENEQKERESFDTQRLIGRVFGTVGKIVLVFFVLVLGMLGASLATNLNLYRNASFRILYAIYGFLFFWIVIPYVLLYRWWWQGHRPRFYALLPIVPYHLDHPWAALFFSWLSYKPDDRIAALKEWETN
jgi:hypothetical protein